MVEGILGEVDFCDRRSAHRADVSKHKLKQAEVLFPSRPLCVLYSWVLGNWR
jgi:hypothetical protein